MSTKIRQIAFTALERCFETNTVPPFLDAVLTQEERHIVATEAARTQDQYRNADDGGPKSN